MAIPQFSDLPFIKNLASELLNSVSKYNNKGIQQYDTRLYQRKTLLFRDIIDSVLPSMLIVDLNNAKKELIKYKDIVSSLSGLLGTEYVPSDIELEKFRVNRLSDAEIDLLLLALSNTANYLTTKVVGVSSKTLQSELNNIISQTESQSNAEILKKAKTLFSKPYKLLDVGGGSKQVFIFPSFEILTGQVGRALNIGLDTALATSSVNISRFSTIGQLLQFGHTAVGYTEGDELKVQFNSPKLFGILYDILTDTNTADPEVLARLTSIKFLQETKQIEEYVEIEKDFSEGFLKLFVSIGGNIVRFENGIVNEKRGLLLESRETRGTNRVILQKLGQEIKGLQGKLASEISRGILIGRSSPSVLDYIKYNIVNTLEGKQVVQYKGSATSTIKTTVKNKAPVFSGLVKKLPTITRTTKSTKPAAVNTRISKPRPSLTSLQRLLDGLLVEQVKRNMGSGNRRDILNLDTGRFAESVKVERLSESRQGMITAFYSYMKYPYATFSRGGRQERPFSRDPKLLIAKSIREIAAEQVQNRLRAVNI